MTLVELLNFKVPQDILAGTEEELTQAGMEGFERFVLWSGVVEGTTFLVRTSHVPKQTSFQLDSGLMVRVEGDALHGLNAWLYEHHEMLAVQVHAHPTRAFHSDTDDSYPIVTALGSLSIVAADFCRDGLFSPRARMYRLDASGWRQVKRPSALMEVT